MKIIHFNEDKPIVKKKADITLTFGFDKIYLTCENTVVPSDLLIKLFKDQGLTLSLVPKEQKEQ